MFIAIKWQALELFVINLFSVFRYCIWFFSAKMKFVFFVAFVAVCMVFVHCVDDQSIGEWKYHLIIIQFKFIYHQMNVHFNLFEIDKNCVDQPQSGRCLAEFRSYYYNPKTGCCEGFVYGGCGGNGNRYETLEECRDGCEKANGFQQLCPPPPVTFPVFA